MPNVDNLSTGEENTPREPSARQFSSSSGHSSLSRGEEDDAGDFKAAWDHLRAGADADAQLIDGSQIERERQQASLIDWAQQSGRLISDLAIQGHQVVSNSTSEHEVRYRISDERAVKVTWPGFYGQIPVVNDGRLQRNNAAPAQYLVRMILHNTVFGGDILLEGIHVSDRPSLVIGEPAGQPSLVVSQPWHHAADPGYPIPSAELVDEFMRLREFLPVLGSYFGWLRRDGVAVADAKPDNFILTTQGVVPIDLQVTQLDPASLQQFSNS